MILAPMKQTQHSGPERALLEALLQDLYAARAAGDLPRLCSLFAPTAVLRISGSSAGKPISVAARGAEEIRSWLEVLLKTFRISPYEIKLMVIDGLNAAVQWRAGIHSRVTGVSTSTELVDLIETDSGRIRSYVEVFVPGG